MPLKGISWRFIGGGLSPEDRKEALEELFVFGKENQQPFFRRMAVLTLVSTVIATGGLLSDSAAVVIGAMLIAPLMRPVMSAAAAITMGWSQRLWQSILLINENNYFNVIGYRFSIAAPYNSNALIERG